MLLLDELVVVFHFEVELCYLLRAVEGHIVATSINDLVERLKLPADNKSLGP